MKTEYILRTPGKEPPKFVERMMSWAKATNEIAGLIRGILADGIVVEAEAVYLRKWIAERPDVLSDPLVRSLAQRIERVFKDGAVTNEELDDLREFLMKLVPENESPTCLPLDVPAPNIIFKENTFCFTGTFISGKRSWCEEQVVIRGGHPIPKISTSLNYLVIGSKVSGAWINQTYGRKIEEGLRVKEVSKRLFIIGEDHWLTSLKGENI